MALIQWSETNFANSFSLQLATELRTYGYLIYWHAVDAVQTPGGWYYAYAANQTTYLADPTFAGYVTAAKGLLTLKGKVSTNPEYPVRHTLDGKLSTSVTDITVPSLSVEVGPMGNAVAAELGTKLRHRSRPLWVYGYARNEAEQTRLRDALAAWFDEHTPVPVLDHDSGTLTELGTADLVGVTTDSAIVVDESDATTYEVILSARLEFQA